MKRAAFVAAALMGAARFYFRARVPDDYDSIGFQLSLDDFDLAKFQPQFPGYPVYVALGRAAHLLFRSPLEAATFVSATAGAATTLGLFGIAQNESERAAWGALLIGGGAALPLLLGGAALSDATGAALAVLAFWALVEKRAVVAGILAGLMLGARLSYWPLALSLIFVAWRARAALVRSLAGVTAGVVAWALPLLSLAGVRRFVALGRAHLRGHFSDWGGTIATRPEPLARGWAFVRHLFYDGMAPSCLASVPLAILLFTGARKLDWKWAAAVCAPYALWTLLGQNVIDQPRHLLPLELALCLALAFAAAQHKWALPIAVALVWSASLPAAWARAHTAPAAAQAADWVAKERPDQLSFGGRSMRFFRLRGLAAEERTWLSEVDVTLERVDKLPMSVVVTSEVETDERRRPRLSPATPGATFCRTGLLDGGHPCLTVFDYSTGRKR